MHGFVPEIRVEASQKALKIAIHETKTDKKKAAVTACEK